MGKLGETLLPAHNPEKFVRDEFTKSIGKLTASVFSPAELNQLISDATRIMTKILVPKVQEIDSLKGDKEELGKKVSDLERELRDLRSRKSQEDSLKYQLDMANKEVARLIDRVSELVAEDTKKTEDAQLGQAVRGAVTQIADIFWRSKPEED